MTMILNKQTYRNERGTASIVVEQYKDKGAGALWRIIYKYDGAALSMTYKDGLLHKPRRATIDRARADI